MDENENTNQLDGGEVMGTEPADLPPAGSPDAASTESPLDQGKARSTRAGIITGVALAAIAALAILLLLDPFNLHLIERLTGRYDAAMRAMPAGTRIYFGFDLRNLSPEKLDRVIKPFAAASREAEIQEYDDMLRQIDESLQQDLGITLSEDILPWIGQYLGVGFLEVDLGGIDPFGYSSQTPEIHPVLAIEARDRAGADDFLEKVGEKWTEDMDQESQSLEYRGLSITYWTSAKPTQGLAYTRVKSVVLIAQSVDDLEQAVDAYHGESLADNPDYKSLLGDLHRDRGLTIFTTGEALSGIYDEMPEWVNVSGQFEIMRGYAMTLAIVDEGVQFDIVASIDGEAYAEEFGEPYPTIFIQPVAPAMVPEASVIYLGGFPINSAWENYRTSMEQAGTAEDVNEALELLSGEIGLDLDEFFAALDGVFALSVIPRDIKPGTGPYGSFLPFDLLLMVGTSQPDEVLEMLEPLAAMLGESIGVDLKSAARGDFTLYDVYDPYGETSIFLFGVGKEHLVLSTSGEVLDQSFGVGPSLATDEGYQQAAAALPGDMDPVMYVDVSGVMAMARDIEGMYGPVEQADEISDPLQALTSVSMGVYVLPGPTVHIAVLAIIQAP